MGRWPAKAVTFLDNHDTHPPHHDPYQFPDNRLLEGYAYILTHPGVPCIYWQHFYDKGAVVHDKIKELAQIRKEQGITNTSFVNILRAEQDLYAAEIDGKLLVKIGTKSWAPGNAGLSGYSIRAAHGDYTLWTKSSGGTATTFRISRDVGFGNFISIRGSIPQLNNWASPGRACSWTPGNVWVCTVSDIPAGQSFEWKALKNDSLWESGSNHTGSGGGTYTIVPGGL
jgi:alpha-amylase